MGTLLWYVPALAHNSHKCSLNGALTMKGHMNIPIFIPHEGCPNDCIFCNQRKISGSACAPTEVDMMEIIRQHLNTFPSEGEREIAFFGGSFTGLPLSEQEKYLQIAEGYVKQGLIQGIRLSTRPDYIDEVVLALLSRYSVKTIELGIQSLDQEVLQKSRRYYSPERALQACCDIKERGFMLGVQMMLGLPGDTLDKSIQTAKQLIDIKPDMVRIYPTLVIRETGLEEEYIKGHYRPLTLEQAVLWSSQIVLMFEAAGVQVLRIGLQHSENLQPGAEVAAGPVHPAFGELVYSQIWLQKIISALDSHKVIHGKSLIIHVPPSALSKAVGQHKRNIEVLKKTYGFTSIKVLGDGDELNPLRLEVPDPA